MSPARPRRGPADGPAAAPTQPSSGPSDPGAARPRGLAAWYRARSRRARLWLGAAVALAVVVAGLAVAGTAGGGSTAPLPRAAGFSVPVLGQPGQRLSLSAYQGRPVIVNFFASWCAPCQRETPLLAAYYRGAHGRVTMVGIDVNDPATAALPFVHKMGVGYPVGVDAAPMPVAAAYNVAGLPQTFFLNARHQIVKRVFGAVTRQQLAAGIALMKTAGK
jgi:cytochrome c biogenesis protein CcmG, thiol:disulfide interchange protein DsbE